MSAPLTPAQLVEALLALLQSRQHNLPSTGDPALNAEQVRELVAQSVAALLNEAVVNPQQVEAVVSQYVAAVLAEYAKKTEIPATLDPAEIEAAVVEHTAAVLTDYATKAEIPAVPDLSGYATKAEIPTVPDLSGYALKSEVSGVPEGTLNLAGSYVQGQSYSAGDVVSFQGALWVAAGDTSLPPGQPHALLADFIGGRPTTGWTYDEQPAGSITVTTDLNFGGLGTRPPGSQAALQIQTGETKASTVSRVVTVTEDSVFTFWEAAQAEGGNYDVATVRLNGVEQLPRTPSTGTVQQWRQRTLALAPGTHTVSWTYKKDGSGNTGRDAYLIANITLGATTAVDVWEALNKPPAVHKLSNVHPDAAPASGHTLYFNGDQWLTGKLPSASLTVDYSHIVTLTQVISDSQTISWHRSTGVRDITSQTGATAGKVYFIKTARLVEIRFDAAVFSTSGNITPYTLTSSLRAVIPAYARSVVRNPGDFDGVVSTTGTNGTGAITLTSYTAGAPVTAQLIYTADTNLPSQIFNLGTLVTL